MRTYSRIEPVHQSHLVGHAWAGQLFQRPTPYCGHCAFALSILVSRIPFSNNQTLPPILHALSLFCNIDTKNKTPTQTKNKTKTEHESETKMVTWIQTKFAGKIMFVHTYRNWCLQIRFHLYVVFKVTKKWFQCSLPY